MYSTQGMRAAMCNILHRPRYAYATIIYIEPCYLLVLIYHSISNIKDTILYGTNAHFAKAHFICTMIVRRQAEK